MKQKLLLLLLFLLLLDLPLHAADPDNYSGTITTGGTSQLQVPLVGAGTSDNRRRYLLFQNISADTLWLNFDAAAVQDTPSIKVLPDGVVVFECSYIPSGALHVIGPNTGAKFVCKAK